MASYRGVSFHKASGQWEACLTVKKKKHYLGLHKTAREAALAYDREALKRCAAPRLNFPEERSTSAVYAEYVDAVSALRAATTPEEKHAACAHAEALQLRFQAAMEAERAAVMG